jgi:hypothetical protein
VLTFQWEVKCRSTENILGHEAVAETDSQGNSFLVVG